VGDQIGAFHLTSGYGLAFSFNGSVGIISKRVHSFASLGMNFWFVADVGHFGFLFPFFPQCFDDWL